MIVTSMGGSTGYVKVFNPSSSSVNELISFSINNISAIDSTGTATGGYAISYASNGSIYTSIYSVMAQPEVTDHLIFAVTQLSRKLNRTYYRMDLLPWFGNMKDQMEMNQTLSTFNLT